MFEWLTGEKKSILSWLDSVGLSAMGFLTILFLLLVWVINYVSPFTFSDAITAIWALTPIWAPVVFSFIFWERWFRYVRAKFMKKYGWVLLEIKLPREITKSPLAMEPVFAFMNQRGSPTYHEDYLEGKHRPWFSLELVSLEGKVHFYVWTQPRWRRNIEAQFYAQYPDIEIVEADDYTKGVVHDLKTMVMWGTNFKLTNKSVYPIKTYVDYGLADRPDLKEEFKVDPLTGVFEYLGSLGPGEQTWIQILIQAHRRETLVDGRLFPTEDWKGAIDAEVERIRALATPPPPPGSAYPGFPNPTPGQTETIKAIERHKGKNPFEVMIRGIYIAKPDSFRSEGITGLLGVFWQFNSMTHNGLRISRFTDFDHPWEDFMRIRRTRRERKMLDAYKKRSFFQHPYRFYLGTPYVLSSEELATLFHLPGAVAATPTLARIPSKRAEAPPNLPV